MINKPGSGRVVGFVVDIFCTGMIDVANEFKLPTYVFYASNAANLGFNLCIETLCVELKQDAIEKSNLEREIVVPSFVNLVPMKAFPVEYQQQDALDFLISFSGKMREAKVVLVNTFLELETLAVKSFPDTNFPPVYRVGPALNLEGVAGKADDMDAISWLDGHPPLSVVVLCFGSAGNFNEVQVKETALGLKRSG
ncbi:UDP-glucose flavonoid 3-O-glucosyltransferase 6-like [Bidens hawaiensis]|uniref:UDP-glucose flavonoid 3-O-glucosyltransferase 6-like n=1 Tax=Bidens hawaiensis TaxID=980011 RepID=UPI00404A5402